MYKLAEEPEIKLPTSVGSWRKQWSSRKTSTYASLAPLKPFIVWITTNWKLLKEKGIPDRLTCLLTGSKLGKEYEHGCILSPCLFNSYAEYIVWNARLDESQAGIKIAKRNINNLKYADDITIMAESEEELKSLLMRMKEDSEKAGLKHNTQKTKLMASDPIS